MKKNEFKIIGEFYDISKYIGFVEPSNSIYESLQGESELIALTKYKLLTIKDNKVGFEIDLHSVKGCNFNFLGKNKFLVDITTSEDLFSLEFHKKKDSLKFVSNVLKNLRH